MADIDDAEAEVARMDGLENSWQGRVLARLVRAARTNNNRIGNAAPRVQALEDRVTALEAQVAALQPPG